MKYKKLIALAIIGSLVAAPASAGWWKKAKKKAKKAVKEVVQVVDTVSDTLSDAALWVKGIEETAGETGYTGSGSLKYLPSQTPAADSGTLVVGTYNMTGLPQALGGIKPKDAKVISKMLESWNWDIGGIQEDWVVHEELISKLTTDTYPSRSRHYNGNPVLSFGDGLFSVAGFNSFDEKIHREKFKKCRGTLMDYFKGKEKNPDCNSEKGFTVAEVRIASDLTIHFYNLHMSTGADEDVYQPQLQQINDSLNNRSKGIPVIMVGDFNMKYDRKESDDLQSFVQNNQLTDSCFGVQADCGDRLDHMLFKGNDHWALTLISESLVSDGGAGPEGGHHPRQMTLGYERLN